MIPSSIRMTSTPVLTDSAGNALVVSPPEPEAAASDATPASATSPNNNGWRSVYHTAPLTKPGLYWLSLGDRKTPIAVNVPAADEADVTTINNDAIRHDLGDITMTMLGAELPNDAGAGRDSNDFSWWTMMLVLALVGFECFIAMRFGHYRRNAVAPPSADRVIAAGSDPHDLRRWAARLHRGENGSARLPLLTNERAGVMGERAKFSQRRP